MNRTRIALYNACGQVSEDPPLTNSDKWVITRPLYRAKDSMLDCFRLGVKGRMVDWNALVQRHALAIAVLHDPGHSRPPAVGQPLRPAMQFALPKVVPSGLAHRHLLILERTV
jgi:hypothetical protein